MNFPTVILGPVIGKVDEKSARILIELDKYYFLTLALIEVFDDSNKNQENSPTFILTNQCKINMPQVFEFKRLKENTKYQVLIQTEVKYLNEELASLTSFFRTTNCLEKSDSDFKIAFLSCNSSKYRKKIDDEKFNLWNDLRQKVKSEKINYIIHMGDQVYIDDGHWCGETSNCFSKSESLWTEAYSRIYKKNAKFLSKHRLYHGIDESEDLDFTYNNEELTNLFEAEKIRLSNEMISLISDEYRETWNYPPTADTLRNVPNLMILDDHEIYDDFGFDVATYFDKFSFEYFFAEKARYCYYKYQKQLWEDVDFSSFKTIEVEHHYHIINGVGLFIQDFRGCFTWLRQSTKQRHFLGNRQFSDFEDCFKPGGFFENTRCAIFVSANPLVFFSKGVSEIAKLKVNDALEQWSLAAEDDQIELLDILVKFRERKQINTVVISGDVHIGCFTYIFKDNKFVLFQMVTSPICQKPPNNIEKIVFDFLKNAGRDLKKGYSFEHTKGTNEMNYGVVRFSANLDKYNVYAYHVKSDGKRFLEEQEIDIGFQDNTRSCCYNPCNIL